MVVDGSIRDADALTALRFPVWATAISPSHPNKQAAGSVNVPVICDGARVNPGDVICADGDGVLVIPRDQLAATVEAAERRQAGEGAIVTAIKAGTSLFELHDMEAAFQASGVREIDAAWNDPATWWARAIHNTARMAWFSSDRSMREYAEEIWRVRLG